MKLEKEIDQFIENQAMQYLRYVRRADFTIHGQMYSMKNSKILSTRAGRVRIVKNPRCGVFEASFGLQCPPEYKRLALGSETEPLRTVVTVWYPSRRQDLDCSVVYDLLQACGVISNDRWIVEKHEYANIDKQDPRVHVIVEAI